MRTGFVLSVLGGMAALVALAGPGRAQEPTQPALREMGGEDLTAEKLVEVLKPRAGVRGIAPASEKPKCRFYQEERARGIQLAPESDIAALQVQFAFNSADLSPGASELLDKLGEALKSTDLAACCFQLEGHTDAIGGDEYNNRLSEQRARTVAKYLNRKFGLDTERLLTVGHGKAQPIADNETDEGRQKNRRVQIFTLGYGGPEE